MKAILEAFSSITLCNKSLLQFDICHFCDGSRSLTNTFNSVVTLHFGARLSNNWMCEESFGPSVGALRVEGSMKTRLMKEETSLWSLVRKFFIILKNMKK